MKIQKQQRIQNIETIKSAGAHLLTIINDILDLSKIEADRMTIESIDTPLIPILHEVTGLMRSSAVAKGLILTTRLQTPVPDRVMNDPTRLRQMLMNLVGNAIKFTETGAVTMTVAAEVHEGMQRLIIDIEDTGPGMTAEQAGHLFVAFGQADNSVTRKYGGSGLGLTICRRLASLMGGAVTLVRSAPNQGSCFRVDLPLLAAPTAKMVEQVGIVQDFDTVKPAGTVVVLNGRILLAEDGVDNQRLIAFHLKKAGATVEIADNGRIAREMLDNAAARGTPHAWSRYRETASKPLTMKRSSGYNVLSRSKMTARASLGMRGPFLERRRHQHPQSIGDAMDPLTVDHPAGHACPALVNGR